MPYAFDHISILLVEDNEPILKLVQSVLMTFGTGRVLTAENGREAFRIFCQEAPDIIITDQVMTPVSGTELAHRIRTDARSPNPYVPIIMITAFTEKERLLAARDTGITEFLAKPFNARDLYRRLAQVIENPRKFVRAGEFFGPDRRRKRNIEYKGALKRKTDITDDDYNSWKIGFSS